MFKKNQTYFWYVTARALENDSAIKTAHQSWAQSDKEKAAR
jgi:hypothetical protein